MNETTRNGRGTHEDDANRSHGALVRLAALARIAEGMAGGDLRVLVGELRSGLEALAGPIADVVPLRRPK